MCSAAVPILPSVLNSTSGQEEHLPLIGIESARFVITSVGFFIAQVSHRISLCAIPVDFKLHHYQNYCFISRDVPSVVESHPNVSLIFPGANIKGSKQIGRDCLFRRGCPVRALWSLGTGLAGPPQTEARTG